MYMKLRGGGLYPFPRLSTGIYRCVLGVACTTTWPVSCDTWGPQARATVASRKHGGREGEMQSTYARALHTDLLYQFRRPGVAERASWPSPPAEHPASLSTADQDVHRGSSPSPITSDHARLPAAPKGAPLNRVRLAMEQHDVIASVWKLESAEVVMVDAVAGRGQLLPEGVCNLQFWDSLGRVYELKFLARVPTTLSAAT